MPSNLNSRLLDMSAEVTEACLGSLDAVSLVTCRLVRYFFTRSCAML